MNNPIGIFDSGVGGLTVAKAIKEKLPNEQIIYYGDTEHMPYGDKSKEAIQEYSIKITKFLLENNCKVILIACNTASANAYEEVKKYVGDRAIVIDVINPTGEYLKDSIDGKKGAVIGTKSTINSGSYEKLIKKNIPNTNLVSLATPLFASMIEEGFINDEVSDLVIESYLSNEKLRDIEYLILGCTHYPLIKDQVNNFFNGKVDIYDSSVILANYLYEILEDDKLLNTSDNSDDIFYVSDFSEHFSNIAKVFFGEDITLKKELLNHV